MNVWKHEAAFLHRELCGFFNVRDLLGVFFFSSGKPENFSETAGADFHLEEKCGVFL